MGVGGVVLEPLLLLIGCGTKCPVVVQVIGDPPFVHAGQKQRKNAFYHFGGLGINQQGVFVIRVFHIAIGGIRTDKLTVAAFHIKYLPDFLWGLVAVLIVHYIRDRHDNVWYAVRVAVAVHTLRQADKPYIQPDKQIFNQVPGIGIVTGEAGQVFDNYAVDPAAIHIGQEPLEIFTVGIRPGFAVIHIHILLGSVIKLVQMGLVVLFQKPPLVDNAVAFVPATE